MQHFLLDVLCCPDCRSNLALNSVKQKDNEIIYGSLICTHCFTEIPIISGFPLFTEASICVAPASLDKLCLLEEKLFKKEEAYASFLFQKSKRAVIDPYAAFQPFNESTHSFFPFLSKMRELLSPQDIILDTWCRTGWSGECLAGLFPNQKIISLWESNSDVLGYRGFRYWLNWKNRLKNLEIIFHSPNERLPFKDGVLSIVHALDSLHRYRQTTFIHELLRITKPHGAIFFPHVHMTNAEPKPYFDRGGIQHHGTFYKRFFDQLLERSKGWEAMVLSEPKLFVHGENASLIDDSNTSDYNGLIALVPKSWKGQILSSGKLDIQTLGRSYLILNPLLDIDQQTGEVTVAPQSLLGQTEELLERHPIYKTALGLSLPFYLNKEERRLIYWCRQLFTIEQIAGKMNLSLGKTEELIAPMRRAHILEIAPTSESMARLQNFYCDQRLCVAKNEETLSDLLQCSFYRFSSKALVRLKDEQAFFTYEETQKIVARICQTLTERGLVKGDKVLVHSAIHAEAFFLFWAAAYMGCIFVPVDPDWSIFLTGQVIEQIKPKAIFCDRERAVLCKDAIVFDDNNEAPISGLQFFSDWLTKDEIPFDLSSKPLPEDPAVILYTSGTTGVPKGIVLSQGALYRSGKLLATTYEWREEDILFSPGNLNTMSGLRNPAIAILHVGASCLVSTPKSQEGPLNLVECIHNHQVTILSTIPLSLKILKEYSTQIEKEKLFSLRFILSTGSPLSVDLSSSFEDAFSIRIFDYYGLTETSGFCFGFTPKDKKNTPFSIGYPIGCVAEIVDENDNIVEPGKEGELRISSENLMFGYYENPELTKKTLRSGWLYTGDLVKRDEKGEYILVGRKKEIIKDSQGNLIYPSEVETILEQHPEVKEAGVCPFFINLEKERLIAFVTPSSTSLNDNELSEILKNYIQQKLGRAKVPAFFVFKKNLPRGANGKILKSDLIEEYASHVKSD